MIVFKENIDRLLSGMPMHESGRINKIFFTVSSCSVMNIEKYSVVPKKWLMTIGIVKNDIIIESESRNTYENALFTTEKLKELYPEGGNFLLITSAIHMRRSKACFKKIGFDVDIYPVDYMSSRQDYYFDDYFIPRSSVLG